MASARDTSQTDAMYPRHRLDGLADSIFGVAMTLLVLDIRIPDGADPHTDRELAAMLLSLGSKIWPYVLSFLVLGSRWRALIRGRVHQHLDVSHRYVQLWLLNLLLVTLVPFSTIVLGRYASLAPSIWLYSANLAGMAICSWGLSIAAPAAEREQRGDSPTGLIVFLFSAALAAVLSVLNTPWACAAFLINGLTPLAERAFPRRDGANPNAG
jgi:uncharacterized membrane protein